MQILGNNLEELFNRCGRRFSLKTVLVIWVQLLKRFEDIHSRGFLHRDIKPENFVVGVKEQRNMIYVIDYGLSKKFLSKGQHIPYKVGKSLTGTARYASINCHKGIEQG